MLTGSSCLTNVSMQMSGILYHVKVKNPEDASNFLEPAADAGKDPNAGRYQSTGIFKDF